MKRKVIRQGNNALTITLPRQWAIKQSIQPGDTVSLVEDLSFPGALILAPDRKSNGKRSAFLDMREISEESKKIDTATALEVFMHSCYRYGYDTILVKYSSSIDYLRIEKRVGQLPGFEITKKTANSVTIETVSSESEMATDFLKEILLTLSEMFVLAQEKTTSSNAEYLSVLRWKIVRYDNMSRRRISRQTKSDSYSGSLHFTHSRTMLLAAGLDRLYKLLKEKSCKKKSTYSLLSVCNQTLVKMRLAFASNNLPALLKLHKSSRNILYKQVYSALEQAKGSEAILLYHVGDISRTLHMLNNSLIGVLVHKKTN